MTIAPANNNANTLQPAAQPIRSDSDIPKAQLVGMEIGIDKQKEQQRNEITDKVLQVINALAEGLQNYANAIILKRRLPVMQGQQNIA